ncbi:sulfotransferase domain-containing protein [Hoeflea marina]|uniref:Sulfotransferase domain-containing protein n=1 Tax=Hoeflea marina TaxID=274592 RepID=A0A317PQ46_9HYPH|nr:sulfotransferase domain-containing protein [Hoeflea marina]
MRKNVDFFIIGVQKGGTTALDRLCRSHPSMQMAAVKEVHFFDDEAIDWAEPCYQRLHDAFDWSTGDVLRGESTPIYIYWPQALARLRRYNPDAKLILALRHPGRRAFSQWRMERKRSNEALTFDEVISVHGRLRVHLAEAGAHPVYSYVERGFYAAQIERLFDIFPRHQVHFLRTDLLWREPATTLAGVSEFLGIGGWDAAAAVTDYVAPIANAEMEIIPLRARAKLDTIFRGDIARTAELTGLNLSDWLDPDYQEPMRTAAGAGTGNWAKPDGTA